MKDFNDLLNSGISDELLAAYIDGNTSESENQLIENFLKGDSMLSETLDIAHDSVFFGNDNDWNIHKGDFGFWELGLPPAVTEADLIDASDKTDVNIIDEGTDVSLNLDTFNPLNDGFMPLDTSTLNNLQNTDISDGLDGVDDLGDILL